MTDITPQQKQFVDEFLKLKKSSQRQAAINAGYSEKSADSQASQLLKNPKVQAYLQERERQITQQIKQKFLFDALDAQKTLLEIMKDENARDRDRLTAAKDILDRAGFKPDENYFVELESKPVSETIEQINAYLEARKKQL